MKIIGAFTFYNEIHLIIPQIESMMFLCDEVVALSDDPTQEAYNIASSFVDENRFHLLANNKTDNFHQRDEVGDRNKLLEFAKSRGATTYYYADVDEVISLSTLAIAKEYINNIKENEIYLFPRYDFWHNAHNYRLLRDNKSNGREIIDVVSPHTSKYVFSTKNALSFNLQSIPNFHAPRIPNFSIPMHEVIKGDIKVFHYGYFNTQITDRKRDFYLQNSATSNVNWGKDMSVSTEEYKKLYGIGKISDR